MHELVKIEVKQELVVLMGDLNKYVGDIIEGNHSKVTFVGQLIRNLLKTEKYQLVNSSSKVVDGLSQDTIHLIQSVKGKCLVLDWSLSPKTFYVMLKNYLLTKSRQSLPADQSVKIKWSIQIISRYC